MVEPNPKRDLGEILMLIAAGVGLVWWASRDARASSKQQADIFASYEITPTKDGLRVEWSINNGGTDGHTATPEVWVDGVRKASTNIFIPPGEGRDVWQFVELSSDKTHIIRLQLLVDGKVYWAHEFSYSTR